MPKALDECYHLMLARARKKAGLVDIWVQMLFNIPTDVWNDIPVICLSLSALQASEDHSKMSSYTLAQWLSDSEYLRRQVYTQSAGLLQIDYWPNTSDMRDMISTSSNVKLGWLFATLGADLLPAQLTHQDKPCLTLTNVDDLLKYISGNVLPTRCSSARFRPIHRTVHQFFLDRIQTNPDPTTNITFAKLLGCSLKLLVLFSISEDVSRPQPRYNPTRMYSVESDMRDMVVSLLKHGPDIDLKSTLDNLAEFVRFLKHHVHPITTREERYLIPAGRDREFRMDLDGFVHYLGFNIMSRPSFSAFSWSIKSYSRGYLYTCLLLGCKEMTYPSRDLLSVRAILTSILTMSDNDTDMQTPQIFTNNFWSLHILSPMSTCLLQILQLQTNRQLSTDHLEELLDKLHVRLSHSTIDSPGDCRIENYQDLRTRTSFVESEITMEILTATEIIMPHMPARNLFRLVIDLLSVSRTEKYHSSPPLTDYGKIIEPLSYGLPPNSEELCRQVLLDSILGTRGKQPLRFYPRTIPTVDLYSTLNVPAPIPWEAPGLDFVPTGNDWYFKGSLREWHRQRQQGEVVVSEEFEKWEQKSGLTISYGQDVQQVP